MDLGKMLFDADRRYTPGIRPGLYYSLPEWYNPADPWSGHGPRNPYTGQPVPYTGYKPVADYVHDYQVPQLEEIVHRYDPQVLWCDIGTPATERSVLRDFYNQALARSDDVTVDNRCGLPDSDFGTQTQLRQIGRWLSTSGEAIYRTTYWSCGATDVDLRFTVKQNKAFYITSLTKPGDQVVVHAPVPIHDGDRVTMPGYDGPPLHWTKQGGTLVIDVPPAAADAGQYAWTLKIAW